MANKYWFVVQELDLPKFARHSSVASPGLATTRDDPYSLFDKTMDAIRQEAEALIGSKPELINFKTITNHRGYGFETVQLKWCVFNEAAALAFTLLVSGKIVEHDWDTILIDDLSEEDHLNKYFEEVVTKSWNDG